MTSVSVAVSDAWTSSREAAPRWQRALDANLALRGLTLRRLAWAGLVVLLFTASSTFANAIAADGGWPSLASVARYGPGFFGQYSVWIALSLLAGILADRWPVTGVRRGIVTFAALFAAGLLAAAIQEPLVFKCVSGCPEWGSTQYWHETFERGVDMAIYACALAMVYYAQRRDAQIAIALRASEMARADAERERLSSMLQTVQARVDPAFLLDAMREVGARHVNDRDGIRLLDLLIEYLRAALPRTDERTSTVQRELTLLRAWLDIAALRSDGELAVECAIERGLQAEMPPLTLVPLAAAVAHDVHAGGAVRVVAARIDRRARVTLEARGGIAAALATENAVAAARERLHAFHGDRAALMIDRRDGRALQVIVEVPSGEAA